MIELRVGLGESVGCFLFQSVNVVMFGKRSFEFGFGSVPNLIEILFRCLNVAIDLSFPL